jgi:hypothetical protein
LSVPALTDAELAVLRDPATIRQRAGRIHAAALAGELTHFRLQPTMLESLVDYVIETIKSRYPDLRVPYHSRWRHFDVGGVNRWNRMEAKLPPGNRVERGRVQTELAICSVLLDAGAGAAWQYRSPADGQAYRRSEGLAVASIDLYEAGFFSSDRDAPHRADAAALAAVTGEALAEGFQVSAVNPMVGLTGRLALLNGLGRVVQARPDVFGQENPRVGGLFDCLTADGERRDIELVEVLSTLLDVLADVWPDGLWIGGRNLGDVGKHGVLEREPVLPGLMPFHKLSQWLTYSLVEPLEQAGVRVTGLAALTGLPEYRNGGLLVDLEALIPQDASAWDRSHAVDSEFVVEWRALTVTLLDQIATGVRTKLGMSETELSLAAVLEGGTWAAGRRAASERRPDGSPPFRIDSGGTVF